MINVKLHLYRERLSQWRLLRKEQEKNLQDSQAKERATTVSKIVKGDNRQAIFRITDPVWH